MMSPDTYRPLALYAVLCAVLVAHRWLRDYAPRRVRSLYRRALRLDPPKP